MSASLHMSRPVKLHIDLAACRLCRKCLAAQACRLRAIVRIDPDEAPFLDSRQCNDCRLCLAACPFGAISILHRYNP
jgi:Fe-S-cluster-containing hydrogenase component 2